MAEKQGTEREGFATRLGFILVSAGCAIGLGNVWRFPYITGEYGGAAFVLLYLLFIVACVPVVVMEYAIGRASRKSFARCFDTLEPKGTKWHRLKWFAIVGNYLLMMFYTVICGWMIAYIFKLATGQFNGASSEQVALSFAAMQASPFEMIFWMVVTCLLGLLVCSGGVKNGVERITKPMMVSLLALLIVLCVRALTLPGAGEGVSFYLTPDFSKIFGNPEEGMASNLLTFGDAAYAAMGQAFFSMSVGMGSMAIFGSYINKRFKLGGEAVRVTSLNVLIALLAGLLIFPACFAYGVQPDSGPSLVFITLPSIFSQMWGGQVWGALFFVFLSFAALSTVIAVFESIIAFAMDQWGMQRKQAVVLNGLLIIVLSIPCALGFNLLSGVQIPGIGDIQSIEDFIVSNNVLPLGSLVVVLFCTLRRGWGWDNFIKEANTGEGRDFPQWLRPYLKYVLPALILIVFAMGYVPKFQIWLGLA